MTETNYNRNTYTCTLSHGSVWQCRRWWGWGAGWRWRPSYRWTNPPTAHCLSWHLKPGQLMHVHTCCFIIPHTPWTLPPEPKAHLNPSTCLIQKKKSVLNNTSNLYDLKTKQNQTYTVKVKLKPRGCHQEAKKKKPHLYKTKVAKDIGNSKSYDKHMMKVISKYCINHSKCQ